MPEGDESGHESRTSGAPRIARNTVVLALSRVGDRVSGFVVALVIAPRLGASGLGTFTAASAIYGLLATAGQAGTTNYLIREISRDRSRTGSYLVHLSAVGTVVSLLLIAGFEALVPHLGYTPAMRTSVSIVALAVLPTVLNSIQEAAFVAHGRVEFETLSTFAQSIAYISICVYLLTTGHGVPALMRTFVALEYAVTFGYFVLISRYIAPLRVRFRASEAMRLMREIKAFAASSALAAFFARPEVVILSLMASPKEVGYYGAAIRVADLPVFVPQVFMTNVFTVLSRAFVETEQRFRAVQAKAVRYTVAFALLMAALIFGGAPSIIGLLFGSHFHSSVTPLRILAVGIVFTSLFEVLWRSLAARGRQGTVLGIQVGMLAVRLGGSAALIAPLAAVGAAISATVSYAVHVSLLAIGVRRSGAPPPILRQAWRLSLAALATGAATWACATVVPVWVALPAGVLVYAAGAFAFRAVTAEDRELFSRLARSRT